MHKHHLPELLYRSEQVRHGERLAAKASRLSMYQLMERAGAAAYENLVQLCPPSGHVLVGCGGGNNGGDGYVVARLARLAGYQVTLWQAAAVETLPPDARRAYESWLAVGGTCSAPQLHVPEGIDVIVDALLGTGLSGTVRSDMATVIQTINGAEVPVLAIDVPSGLCADRGVVLGDAVVADITVTFIGCKQGLVTGHAADYVGQLVFAGLGIADEFESIQPASSIRINKAMVVQALPARRRCAHKGDHGRILCAGGDLGMGGAIRLAAEAALRSGAGLTAVLTQPDNVLAINAAVPEIMARGWQDKSAESREKIQWADVIVLGPGLGQSNWGRTLYDQCSGCDKPMVLDADGLNLLALSPDYKNNRIITPHPGEAARLLDCSVADIEHDRFAAAKALQLKYGGVVLLKGAGTIVYDGTSAFSVCVAGNPGMATGGMGDVLSGVIGALLGQGLSLLQAAQVGSWIHATAADCCAQAGERGMVASDLFPFIRKLVNSR
ncbi:NAD(P)H-hydrate epimerase [Photobacterium aquae]|uniref:Bifunctional NAD(P)H-hydrate repair enzyme n=1 Tax=Photobacterium aquae TaxID=1195763 RepID=A0A0J1GIF8_9GAMM|nr:bifunctional ADP-dependent NAD(P)H-hydrate dehydratase/NAD(P)H-hydrate epimerase [Photobacterium aquae]KLU99479.1 NAD(P)H-hydrate epimerase [Photobacterium aquae]